MDEAASNVHETPITLNRPLVVPTPYGGKLEWTLPGHNKLVAHLKDKILIRHRKRWSQVCDEK
jgi:chitin synthase